MAAEVVTWIDPDGVETALGVEWDVDGRFATGIDIVADRVPGRPGQSVREVRHDTRPISMPVWIGPTADDVELRSTLRDLVYRLDPVRGPGVLRVQSPIGDTREIECYGQLSMPERLGDTSGVNVQRAVVTFTAYDDPYWRAVSDTSLTITKNAAVPFFPFFPLRLTASEIFRDIAVTNPGQVEAWPIWQIDGPGEAPVIWNLSKGVKLSLPTLTLGAGEYITIDTRPGAKSVVHSDGSNAFSLLETGSSLWGLRTGVNSLRVEMGGALTAASQAVLRFRPRYLAP